MNVCVQGITKTRFILQFLESLCEQGTGFIAYRLGLSILETENITVQLRSAPWFQLCYGSALFGDTW